MTRVRMLVNYKDYQAKKEYLVGNNEAFGMIDAGVARLVVTKVSKPRRRKTRMLRAGSKKGYQTK